MSGWQMFVGMLADPSGWRLIVAILDRWPILGDPLRRKIADDPEASP